MSISIGGKTVESIVMGDKTVNTIVDSNNNLICGKPYLQKNYIQSSGTQYIDTGFKPNQDTKVIVDFMLLTTLKYNGVYWAGGSNWTDRSFGLYNGGTGTTAWTNYNDDQQVQMFNLNTKYTAMQDKNKLYYNDVLKFTHSSSTFQSPNNLWIGYVCVDWQYGLKGRIYNFQLYDNSTLIHKFIPCILTANIPASKDSRSTARTAGTVGMWDTVTDTFYGNAGTGTFVAG